MLKDCLSRPVGRRPMYALKIRWDLWLRLFYRWWVRLISLGLKEVRCSSTGEGPKRSYRKQLTTSASTDTLSASLAGVDGFMNARCLAAGGRLEVMIYLKCCGFRGNDWFRAPPKLLPGSMALSGLSFFAFSSKTSVRFCRGWIRDATIIDRTNHLHIEASSKCPNAPGTPGHE